MLWKNTDIKCWESLDLNVVNIMTVRQCLLYFQRIDHVDNNNDTGHDKAKSWCEIRNAVKKCYANTCVCLYVRMCKCKFLCTVHILTLTCVLYKEIHTYLYVSSYHVYCQNYVFYRIYVLRVCVNEFLYRKIACIHVMFLLTYEYNREYS